ncbi:polysaccharide deacetylase family protein [Lacticaseibacillus paracasei]|uniref:Bifunctional xylanase/deacetylase n=1 Tax=Lacticaseibacillus paracasei TaxID=1597 RepID=A0A8B3GSQ5_LACPA|nr:polysaccharide deacetylase family protein [Lacticaseibacillus paracasei]MBM6414245.1 polysaccharide deacetylase [Lacticaseibacillus paracasei]RNE30786.1 Bifunctional xylanase/deacetylase precursor [Lacticaseibacillus paracasei]
MKSKFRWQWWAVTLGVFLIVIAIFSVKLYADRHAAAMAASKTHAKSVSEHEAAVASSWRHAARKASKRHVAAVSSRRRAAAEASRKEAQSKAAQVGQNHIAEANQYAYPVAQVKQEMDAPYTSPIKEKVVFLTFDDGPNTVNSPKVLDILSQAGVHGTFFVVGKQVSLETAPVLKAEYDAGHAIGLHSMTHDYSLLYPSRVGATAVIENEAKGAQAAVQQVLGSDFRSHIWRYPGGHFSWKGLAAADVALSRLGLDWIDWDAAVGDALSPAQEPKTEDAMLQYHLRSLNVYPASNVRVVLMHDALGKDLTVKTLPRIIQYYRDNGYKFGVLE